MQFKRWRLGLFFPLVLIGLGYIASGSLIYLKSGLAQVLLLGAWEYTRLTGAAVRPWPWADTKPVARLLVESQAIDLIVLEGSSGRTLAFAPGHMQNTVAPGKMGHSIIAGHRDTHFNFLRKLRVGESLVVQAKDQVNVHYTITQTAIVHKDQVMLRESPQQRWLSLVTCYPFDAIVPGGPLRYVVVAQAQSEPPSKSVALRLNATKALVQQ